MAGDGLTVTQIEDALALGKSVSLSADGKAEIVQKAVASAIQIVVGLTDNRQITFSTGYESDEDDEAVNARLDRNMRFADRLQARYELRAIEDAIEETERNAAVFEGVFEDAKANQTLRMASREVERAEVERIFAEETEQAKVAVNDKIMVMQDQKQSRFNEGLERFRASGKLGSYVPTGHIKVDIDRIDAAIKEAGDFRKTEVDRLAKALELELQKFDNETTRLENEGAEAVRNHENSVKRYAQELSRLHEKRDRLKAVAEG